MKTKKPLPKNAVLALIVGGGLLLLAAGWMLMVSPEQKKASSLQAQTAQVQQQISDTLAQIAAARNATVVPQVKVAPVYKLAQAMPSIADIPDVLLELDQVAQQSGVALGTISPAAANLGTNGYSTIPITITATGDFYSITDLLYRLRNLVSVRNGALQANGRIFSVQSVTLSPTGRSVTANISLQTYMYGAPASSAPAPAPATTTSTGATTTTTTTTSSGPSAAGATG